MTTGVGATVPQPAFRGALVNGYRRKCSCWALARRVSSRNSSSSKAATAPTLLAPVNATKLERPTRRFQSARFATLPPQTQVESAAYNLTHCRITSMATFTYLLFRTRPGSPVTSGPGPGLPLPPQTTTSPLLLPPHRSPRAARRRRPRATRRTPKLVLPIQRARKRAATCRTTAR